MRRTLLLLSILTACGSSGVAIHDLEPKMEDAYCAYSVRCKLMPDAATCHDAIFDNTQFRTIVAAVDAGKIDYDDALGRACVDLLDSQTCEYVGLTTSATPCQDMFAGKVAAGGACFVSAECENGGRCMPTQAGCNAFNSCCPGTCQSAASSGTLGSACQSSAQCNDNLYCSFLTSQCTQKATSEGASCENIDGCEAPLFCNLDVTARTGTCYRPAAAGASCDPAKFLPCARVDQYCAGTSPTCVDRKGVGAACAQDECVGYATCDATNQCVARPKLGESCTGTVSDCLGNLTCSTTCQATAAMACE